MHYLFLYWDKMLILINIISSNTLSFDIASFGILADCQAAAIAWGCQFLHP